MTLFQFVLLVILSTMWGSSFLFIKLAVETIPPVTLVAGRIVLAAILLYAYLRLVGLKLPRDRRLWIDFMIMGLVNSALPYTLLSWGEIYLDSGLAAILVSAVPIFTVIFGRLFTGHEPFDGATFFGLFLGILGVIFLIGPGALAGIGTHFVA